VGLLQCFSAWDWAGCVYGWALRFGSDSLTLVLRTDDYEAKGVGWGRWRCLCGDAYQGAGN